MHIRSQANASTALRANSPHSERKSTPFDRNQEQPKMANYYGSSIVPSLVGLVIAPVKDGYGFGLKNGEELTIHTQLENIDGTFQLIGKTASGKEVHTRASSLSALKATVLELCKPEGMRMVPFRRVLPSRRCHAPAPRHHAPASQARSVQLLKVWEERLYQRTWTSPPSPSPPSPVSSLLAATCSPS